jgi:uncharacterized damage-inducible protein DinB
MMTDTINKVMQRHLQQLQKEISAYKNESDLWLVSGEITNSAGNLCLHLCGNLQHFVGTILGHTDYVRQRELEFSAKKIEISELNRQIGSTMAAITDTLSGLSPEDLKKDYPVEVFGEPMTTEFFLVHLTSHLGYHLGQINYHRRILTKS